MVTARSVAYIGCRLLALAILAKILQPVCIGTLQIIVNLGGSYPVSSQIGNILTLISGDLLTLAIIWISAGWIADQAANLEAEPNSAERWSRQDALAIGVVVAGLVAIVISLPDVAQAIASLRTNRHFFGSAITLFIGFLLVLGPQNFARLLMKFGRWR